MSRIGKKPIDIPKNVQAKLDDDKVISLKGPKGELSLQLAPNVSATIEDNQISLQSSETNRQAKALYGLNRSLLANMIEGVTNGYERKLQINGVGYKAELKGTNLFVTAGLSHIVQFEQPDGVTFKLESPQVISITGIDKEKVGRIAAEIRDVRPAEPYNGKGIQYVGEQIRRKAGKSGK